MVRNGQCKSPWLRVPETQSGYILQVTSQETDQDCRGIRMLETSDTIPDLQNASKRLERLHLLRIVIHFPTQNPQALNSIPGNVLHCQKNAS